MPIRKKTLRELCDSLPDRHTGLAPRRMGYLKIYVGSLIERFAAMDYALKELDRHVGLAAEATTESFDPFENHKQKRHFYANCFWAFAYSAFDILSHIVNTVHHAVKDESQVSFAGAANGFNLVPKKHLAGATIPQRIRTRIKKTTNRQYFKRLAGYRRCSLHRRAVCVRDKLTQVSDSVEYADSTSTDDSQLVTWICDDPEDMRPKFTKQRVLKDECQTIRDGVEEDVIEILGLL